MAERIADIYEIGPKIGAGGGGIVYLGRHIRLDKKIVLKADKRTLSAGSEKLRREVDLLKGLNHTYIPQVYDFVQEDGIVYTVMDYVEGESLDKLLARRQKIPQKDIVKWACQLLEAISYLHSQKPHGILHGDIKPANIMLRTNGDICLIDFNIALALGEDGAVRVGYSRGYASPEHYGSDGSGADPFSGTRRGSIQPSSNTDVSGAYSSSGKMVMDARSDIYSLGATLYHLLSGKRPEEKAEQVSPLQGCCSLQVAEIIAKSMDPDPDRRYQSADKMLDALLHLHINDQRVVKNKRRFAFLSAVSIALFLFGGAGTLVGMKQTENYQTALMFASYSESALADGNISEAVDQAMRSMDTGTGIFHVPVPVQAQKALTDALGVYDLSDGFKEDGVTGLPAAPFDLRVSPQGTRYAAVYAYEVAVFSVGKEEPDVVRSIQQSALSDCLFLDEDTIIYAGEKGIEAYSITEGRVLWTGRKAAYLALSGDRSVVAAAGREGSRAFLYQTLDGAEIAEISFERRRIQQLPNDRWVDRANYVFALDKTGAWLAVSFSNGSMSVFDTGDLENELILYEASDYEVFGGGFCGNWFAYTAQKAGENFFGILDLQEQALIANKQSRDRMAVSADEGGIYLSDGNLLARFAADTLKEKELAYTEGNIIQNFDVNSRFSMIAADDNAISFYDSSAHPSSRIEQDRASDFVKLADGYALAANREEPQIRVLRLWSHQDKNLFSYNASDVHSEARVSADGQSVMLFDHQRLYVYDQDGNRMVQCALPDAEHIYDQQFRRDGDDSYLEVTWYDGTVRCYGMDGTVIREEKKDAPDEELEEEFQTDHYRIVSKLNEPAQVYEKDSGKLAGELGKEDVLAYVTQLDGYIMAEYVSTTLERYGILLDENLQQMAYLPDLCDVYDSMAVFDCGDGQIRSCKLYSLDELVAMGREYQKLHSQPLP